MTNADAENLNVSLESHLLDTLRPILPILDHPRRQRLSQFVNDTPPPTIPYSLLLDISKWTRSSNGVKALRASSLNPNEYAMIALLAGTTTSPERKFGTYVPPKDEAELAEERKRERKAITTIVNGVLSVGGSGAAAWWGSASTGWKYEWRVLFSFFVAVIVAISETVLYILWQTRSSPDEQKPRKLRKRIREKKEDPPEESRQEKDDTRGLRLRATAAPDE